MLCPVDPPGSPLSQLLAVKPRAHSPTTSFSCSSTFSLLPPLLPHCICAAIAPSVSSVGHRVELVVLTFTNDLMLMDLPVRRCVTLQHEASQASSSSPRGQLFRCEQIRAFESPCCCLPAIPIVLCHRDHLSCSCLFGKCFSLLSTISGIDPILSIRSPETN